jgi:hypothetical protein
MPTRFALASGGGGFSAVRHGFSDEMKSVLRAVGSLYNHRLRTFIDNLHRPGHRAHDIVSCPRGAREN